MKGGRGERRREGGGGMIKKKKKRNSLEAFLVRITSLAVANGAANIQIPAHTPSVPTRFASLDDVDNSGAGV